MSRMLIFAKFVTQISKKVAAMIGEHTVLQKKVPMS